MRRLFLCALLAFAAAGRAQKPVETERKEREEREREARERGQREHREKSEKGKAAPGDDEALYALGAILGSRVNGYGLSKKELQRVERGFADAAEERKLQLRDPDLEGDARPRGGLLEDHPQRPAWEQVMLLAQLLLLFELVREVERAHELLAGPVRHAREVASFQAVERRNHAARCYFFRRVRPPRGRLPPSARAAAPGP